MVNTEERMAELAPPHRILMGPGPSDVHPRVLRVLSTPPIGHFDPAFLQIMDDVRDLLRRLLHTENEVTFPISGTGSAGMEACLANAVESGMKVLVCVKGYFGDRICQMTQRLGGELIRLDKEWGKAFEPDEVDAAVRVHCPQLVCIVHAETSTGVLQPLQEIARIVHEHEAILLVDAVTSLGGVEVRVDDWGWDVVYSGTQKCIGCPPGLAPVTFSPRAMLALERRKRPPASWYFDAALVRTYWGADRSYHHTAPINMVYALREALRLIFEEGLEERWARHSLNAKALICGLEAMGLTLLIEPAYRLPALTTVRVPEGINELRVRRRLLDEYNLEIGGGLGPLKGQIWRIGLMGYSSQKRNVMLLLSALENILRTEGLRLPKGAAIAAAEEVYRE